MKIKRSNILTIFLSISVLTLFSGYYFFKFVPLNRAEQVANNFEIAVRTDDKELINEILYPEKHYWKTIQDPKIYNVLQEVLGRFYEGVEVYSCTYSPSFISSNSNAQIFANGKMKAKKDDKYRKHFIIELETKNGEWKLVSFYFPDFINY